MKTKLSKQSQFMGDRSARSKGSARINSTQVFPTAPSRFFFSSNDVFEILGMPRSSLQMYRERNLVKTIRDGHNARFSFDELCIMALIRELDRGLFLRVRKAQLARQILKSRAPYVVLGLNARAQRHRSSQPNADSKEFSYDRVRLLPARDSKHALTVARKHIGPVHLIHVAGILRELVLRIEQVAA